MIFAPVAPPAPPTLVYAARFSDARSTRTYSHLYLWQAGQKGRGKPITTGATDDTDPKAAPSGKTIYFIRRREKTPPMLCALNRQTGKVRPLYTATGPTDFLGNLRVSPNGFLLFKHAVYTQQSAHPFYEQWVRINDPESRKPFTEKVWLSAARPKGETEAVWATDNDIVLFSLLNNALYPGSASQMMAVTNHASPGGTLKVFLFVDGRTADLKRDISPNGVWILGQASWSRETPKGFKFAQQIRIDDGWPLFAFAAEPGEIMHWLSDRRVVGVAPAEGLPAVLHFFDVPKGEPKSGTQYPEKPVRTVALHLDTAAVRAALGSDYYGQASRLTEMETIKARDDGFVLGTPDKYGYPGVRFWINAQTGEATLWSKCGPPHPSPSGTYFWSQTSKEISKIRPYPDPADYDPTLPEPGFGLAVAAYARPSHSIPLVSGKDRANGADWLPIAVPKRKQKP